MVAHLGSILASGGVYRNKCLHCHGRAVGFVRGRIALEDGRLVGRNSGRDIATFLQSHGRLQGDELATVLGMLERQLTTMAEN